MPHSTTRRLHDNSRRQVVGPLFIEIEISTQLDIFCYVKK